MESWIATARLWIMADPVASAVPAEAPAADLAPDPAAAAEPAADAEPAAPEGRAKRERKQAVDLYKVEVTKKVEAPVKQAGGGAGVRGRWRGHRRYRSAAGRCR